MQYGDWHGTAAMDSPDAYRKIEEFARINPDEWLICAIEMVGGTEAGSDRSFASVLAVRRTEWERLGGADGITDGQRLEVIRFPVRESDALGVLQAMKRWSIHVEARGVEQAQLVVVDEVR